MRGDFSRGVTATPGVSRVLMQQGRVQLDADWNAAAEVADRRTRLALADLLGRADPIGVAAVPRDDAGYAVAARGGFLFDGQACLRVDGVGSLGGREAFALAATIAPRAGGRGGTIAGRFWQAHHQRARGEFVLRVDAHGALTFLRLERGGVRALTAPAILPFDVHTDVAVVCTGERVELYVGARLVATRAAGHGEHDPDVPLLVGAQSAGGEAIADGFDGTMDRLVLVPGAHHHPHRRRHHHDAHGEPPATPRTIALADLTAHGSAHAPQALPARIVAGAGRAYVDGLLCESDREADLAVPPLAAGTALAYLEVWERLVVPAEDPSSLDPALGGIDTSVAVRTEARVRVAPFAQAVERMRGAAARGTLLLAKEPDASLGNQLVRVEVHRTGIADEGTFAYGHAGLLDASRVDDRTLRLAADPGWRAGQPLRLVLGDGTTSGPATVTSASGGGAYAVDQPVPAGAFRVAPLATVKWSRDNGSTAFPLPAASGGTAVDRFAMPDALGRVAQLEPGGDVGRPADVLEVIGADALADGTPGDLVAISELQTDEPDETTVVLAQPVTLPSGTGLVRVWSAFDGGTQATPDGAPAVAERTVSAASALTLAPGLTATFGTGAYASGDFWWAPVRDAADEVWGWPAKDGEPQPQLPDGVERRYAPLALLEPNASGLPDVVDLRRIVEPLADDGSDWFAPPARTAPPAGGDDTAGQAGESNAARGSGAPPREVVVVREDASGDVDVDVEVDVDVAVDEPGARVVHVDVHDDRRERADEVVLSAHAQPPEGFRYTGMTVAQQPQSLRWEPDGDAPRTGRALACAVGDAIYTLFEETGELWARLPDEPSGERARWRRCAARDAGSEGAALVALGGVVYALGGFERGRPHARCDAYDPARDAWDPLPPMRTARAFFGAAALGDRIVVLGGMRRALGFAFTSARVESWTPGEARWRREPRLEMRRDGCAAVGRGRRVYLIGGASGRFWARRRGYGSAIDAVAPFEGISWNRGVLATPQRDARAVLTGDGFVVAGGRAHAGDVAATERFALGGDAGEPMPQLDRVAPALAATGGTLYAAAGEGDVRASAHVERCTLAQPLFVHARER